MTQATCNLYSIRSSVLAVDARARLHARHKIEHNDMGTDVRCQHQSAAELYSRSTPWHRRNVSLPFESFVSRKEDNRKFMNERGCRRQREWHRPTETLLAQNKGNVKIEYF